MWFGRGHAPSALCVAHPRLALPRAQGYRAQRSHVRWQALSEDSIYTLKLVRRGHVVPEGLQAAVYAAQRVQDVMTTDFRLVHLNQANPGTHSPLSIPEPAPTRPTRSSPLFAARERARDVHH